MLSSFTLYQLLAFFLIYSCLGWCVEVVYHAVTFGKLINRGFLNGPVCPIYGWGMLAILLVLTPVQNNLLFVFLGGMLLTSAIELFGGWLLFKLYHTRWWDYTDKPFNLGGYICLEFSLLWGIGTIIMVRVIHPPVAALVALVPHTLGVWVMAVLCILYITDSVVTAFTVAGLNRDLAALDKVAKGLHQVSDAMTEVMGTTAMAADQKFDESRLQMTLAAAEMRESTAAATNAARESASAAAELAREKAANARLTALEAAGAARIAAAGTAERAKELVRLQMQKAELEKQAEALQDDVVRHTFFGGGRLLKAFPQMTHSQYYESLSAMKQKLGTLTKKK